MSKAKSLQVAPRQGGFERIESLGGPSPGQYWRAVADIKGRVDTRGHHGSVASGTVLMISRIEHADGQAHVIVLAPHPSWSRNIQVDLRFHAEDFERLWARELDGAAIREREIDALALSMQETQAAMRQPPPDAAPAGLLGSQPALNQGGETGQELATREGLQAMVAHAEHLKEAAGRQIAWINQHTERLSEQGSAMARFHQERAKAMLAAANAKLEGLDGILSKVKNLKIYVGEGVEVTQLVDGAPAPPDAPITIFQDLLAFDEELLLRLDLGGLDHTMTEDVATALLDPAVADQMIPAPRGLVLVRFRRHLKEFLSVREGAAASEQLAAAQANASLNAESLRHRLLYRDGARFFLIECDAILPAIRQLMPSTAEQNDYFLRETYNYTRHRHEHERITPDDIDYAAAQRAQLVHLNDYARVLICLWGLHDRTDLFATTAIPKFSNWLDNGFQNAHLRLISHDSLIGESRPHFSEFMSAQNAYLAAGAMVAVNLRKAFDEESAPACFSYSGRGGYYKKRSPVGRIVIARVVMEDGKPCIDVDTRRAYDDAGRITKTRMRLLDRTCLLVLDRVHDGDLLYYLSSRSARSDYAGYAELFRGARTFVRERDAREAPWRDWLRAALSEGGIHAEPHLIERAVSEALSVVRASRPSGELPETPRIPAGSKSRAAILALREAILDAAHAALAPGDRNRAAKTLKAWADAQGFTALMLCRIAARPGDDAWVLYREALPDERDPRIDPFPWVVRQTIAMLSDGGIVPGSRRFATLRSVASEQEIARWDDAEKWLDLNPPDGLDHDRAIAALNWIGASAAALDRQDAMAQQLFDAAARHNRGNRTSRVKRLWVDFCVGSVIDRGKPAIIMLTVDAMRAAHAWGDASMRARVVQWIENTYAKPESHLENLSEPVIRENNLWLAPLSLVAKHIGRRRAGEAPPSWTEYQARGVRFDGREAWKKTPKKDRQTRLTSLAPFGAREFPWMVEYCERPTPVVSSCG